MSEIMISALNLMRRLPPSKVNQNTQALSQLNSEIEDELAQRVDQILEIATDSKGNQYILCEYNRDGDNYRSPWTNQYHPESSDLFPSQQIRDLENKANQLFDEYRKQYYGQGVSSTYLWDKQEGGFAVCFLIKKLIDDSQTIKRGSWDSTNIVDVKIQDQMVSYSITSTVILDIQLIDNIEIAGSLTKKKQQQNDLPLKDIDNFHLQNIGSLIESVESDLRSSMDTLLIGKTKEIIFSTRVQDGHTILNQKNRLIQDFNKLGK